MRKPDFLGIGVMKGATTWAWHQLKAHPNVRMPYYKEVHYFDRLEITPEQYLAKFNRIPTLFKTGEITPAYLNVPHAPALVRAFCPSAKLFVILRNPVERAYSHWKVGVYSEHKIPPGTSFKEAFEWGHPRTEPYWNTLREKGNYARYIKRWHSWMPKASLKVMWYDDLVEDPLTFARDLYDWVGVDSSFKPPKLAKKYNENHSGYEGEMKAADKKLALEYYLPTIERLEGMTGRNLSGWKK